MRFQTTPRFTADYCALSPADRRRVDIALRRLAENSRHPGLRLRKLTGRQDALGRDIWYCRASDSLRITCVLDGDLIVLRRVGQHDVERTP